MGNLLLLYDLNEKDLARDLKDLLDEFNIGPIVLMPTVPGQGLSLEEKERKNFEKADGVVFLITPGAERFGHWFPSPSVSHEMGQAKQRFQERPESVIYLVEKDCNLPSIDQKHYIDFNRSNMRSILGAMTLLIKELKEAGIFRVMPLPAVLNPKAKDLDLEGVAKKLPPQVMEVLFALSHVQNGFMVDVNLTKLLREKYNLSIQESNFLRRDLQDYQVVRRIYLEKPYPITGWVLTDHGWAIVRFESERRKKASSEFFKNLAHGSKLIAPPIFQGSQPNLPKPSM